METLRELQREQDAQVAKVELAVSRLLRLGTSVSAILIAAGLAVLLLQLPFALGPTLITIGLITLVCTPLLRVTAALLIYLQLRDYAYAVICILVLAIVCTGIWLGEVH